MHLDINEPTAAHDGRFKSRMAGMIHSPSRERDFLLAKRLLERPSWAETHSSLCARATPARRSARRARGPTTVAPPPVSSWLGGRLETDGVSRPTAGTSRGDPISRRRRTQSRVVPNLRWGRASQVGRLELTWGRLKTNASQDAPRRLEMGRSDLKRPHLETPADAVSSRPQLEMGAGVSSRSSRVDVGASQDECISSL